MAKKKETKKDIVEKIKVGFDKLLLGNIGLIAIFLVFGLIAYFKPYSMHIKTAQIILGVYLIIFGLYYGYEFLCEREFAIFKFKGIFGIISLLLGLWVMINPFKTYAIMTLILGLYLSLSALYKAYEAWVLRKLEFDGWLVVLVVSIILLIFGVFIAINPMKMMDLVEAMGIFIILATILEACTLLMFYTKKKELAKLFKKNI